MAGTKGVYTRVLVGGYLLSGDTNALTIKSTSERQDGTPFEATGRQYVTMAPTAGLTLNGYMTFDTANGATYEARLNAALSTADTVGAILGQTQAGSPAYVLPGAHTQQLQIQAPTAGLMTVSGEWVGSGALNHGLCLYSGSIAATGSQTPVDFGASGTNGFAYLFVTGITGTAVGATITVQSATTSGGSYSTHGTFTFSDIGAQTLAMTGTVNRWVRINCTSKGGATSFIVHAIAGISGVNY